jgi:hypothetical protein
VHGEVREFIGAGAVVDFVRGEGALQGVGGVGDVLHEQAEFGCGEFDELVDVPQLGHDAPSAVGLFIKQVQQGDLQRGDGSHHVMEALVAAAVEAIRERHPAEE